MQTTKCRIKYRAEGARPNRYALYGAYREERAGDTYIAVIEESPADRVAREDVVCLELE